MKLTMQHPCQSVLAHGLSVFSTFNSLISESNELTVPKWYEEYKQFILKNLHSFKTIKHYTIWHDCSKPYVRTEVDGKIHYPNHANESANIWLSIFPNKTLEANLIRNDMLSHIARTVDEFVSHDLSIKDICTLLTVAIAELNANAKLFGGISSDSFKIKLKRLESTGKKVLEHIFPHEYVYVLVREDLSNAQRSVQACHAVIEATRNFNMNGEHPSVIICGVKNEQSLIKQMNYLISNGVQFSIFKEPDLGNELTALATAPISGAARELFKKYQLIK